MVVAHQREHAAMGRGAGHVRVAEYVTRAVDARALAVPEREDAVVLALAAHLGLLGTPAGGGREFFVQPWLEDDVAGLEDLARLHQLLVEPAERRSPVAGDEAAGVEPGAAVALVLHQQQACDGLGSRQEHMLLGKVVLVVERDVTQRQLVRHEILHSDNAQAGNGGPFGLSRLILAA